MAQVMIYTKEKTSSKYRKILLQAVVSSMYLNLSFILPEVVDRIEVLGKDNKFDISYNKYFDDFVKNTKYNKEDALQEGDVIIVDDNEEITFQKYDTFKMCIVSSENKLYLKYLRHA